MAGPPPAIAAVPSDYPAPSHTTAEFAPTGFRTLVSSSHGSPLRSNGGVAIKDVPVSVAGTSTGKGVLIGMLSAFGTAAVVGIILLIVYFFNFTNRGRILLDRLGRPGEYDDEQQFAKDEAEALEEMDDMQRTEYLRAKGNLLSRKRRVSLADKNATAFVQANPPESAQTDISLSQFLAIQEKGVSAWEFEPELEIANCFVEGRTQIEFFDSECSVQSNLPVPKQNEVYYWEAKIYEKPENTLISIGMTTKPYPLFRLPGTLVLDHSLLHQRQHGSSNECTKGWHKTSLAYLSTGHKRHSYPFLHPHNYGPMFVQGDVIGVGYRPRTGSIFFTRNGKKLEDVCHGLKTQNFFPTVGAIGPCQVHVNFGQMGFVFIEANVKKWGLAPMTGSLAPPPPYGSEQGSILLEGGREGVREGMGLGGYAAAAAAAVSGGFGHARTSSGQVRLSRQNLTSPGPQRSPTDISLAQLSLADSHDDDAGEGTSGSVPPSGGLSDYQTASAQSLHHPSHQGPGLEPHYAAMAAHGGDVAPPEYSSPGSSPDQERSQSEAESERQPLLEQHQDRRRGNSPPIPSYDVAVAESQRGTPVSRGRRETR